MERLCHQEPGAIRPAVKFPVRALHYQVDNFRMRRHPTGEFRGAGDLRLAPVNRCPNSCAIV